MKMLIFVSVFVLVIGLLVWRLQKSHREAESARLKATKHRKSKDKKAVTPEIDMVWPVIVKPLKGEQADGNEAAVEEPSMTEIEFEPSGEFAGYGSQSGRAAS